MRVAGQKSIYLTLIFLLGLICPYYIHGQSNQGYSTISGVVKDKRSKKSLEYVNISIPETNIGTVTNSDGEFTLKVQDSIPAKEVEFTHIGYLNYRLPIQKKGVENVEILLTSDSKVLNEVIVSIEDPKLIVEIAIKKITTNYNNNPSLLTGFYRETVQKGKKYIDISEAVIDVYKSPYGKDVSDDRVQIFKGRRLLSPKPSDTLAVKLLGGPNIALYADIVKNPNFILNIETLPYYTFKMEESVTIDEQPTFVISFEPQVNLLYALFRGKLYINKQSIALTRADIHLDMSNQSKATQAILWKKPAKLRFKPEENSFFVTYKQRGELTYLSYVRNIIKFKSDWKRKLFPTNYTVISEMVVTDSKVLDKPEIPYKMAFKQNQSLSDKVSSFYDPNFWEQYNIIEPTESLDSAVGKLKKQYKE